MTAPVRPVRPGGNHVSTVDPLLMQGIYYIATGVWPLVHLRSFMALTGPKKDTWLVQTFGALVAAIGLSLVDPKSRPSSGRTLGVASALALAACEIVFVAQGRIRPIYLADAAVELGLAATTVRAGRPGAIAPDGRGMRPRRLMSNYAH